MTRIGTIKIATPNRPVEVPVYDPASVTTPVVRVGTATGVGVVKLVDPATASSSFLRTQLNSGTYAIETLTESTVTLTTTTALNGQSISLTIYQDNDGGSTADVTETVTLATGTTSVTLSNIKGLAGRSYWVKASFSGVNTATSELGSVELSWDTTSLVWQTTADWDAAVTERGVVHESVTNTDHTNAADAKKGYSASAPYLKANLLQYFPLHEDAGSTIYDFSGNARNGTNSGVTLNQPGILGATSGSFSDLSDSISCGTNNFWAGSSLSGGAWIYVTNLASGTQAVGTATSNCANIWAAANTGSDDNFRFGYEADGRIFLHLDNGAGNEVVESTAGVVTENTWYYASFNYYSATGAVTLYVNATQVGTGTMATGGPVTNGPELLMGRQGYNTSQSFQGKICDARLYGSTTSQSKFQVLYDIAATDSALTTATQVA